MTVRVIILTAVCFSTGVPRALGETYQSHGKAWPALSSFLICTSEDQKSEWAVESHQWKSKLARRAGTGEPLAIIMTEFARGRCRR
jgi:hypothetical protein